MIELLRWPLTFLVGFIFFIIYFRQVLQELIKSFSKIRIESDYVKIICEVGAKTNVFSVPEIEQLSGLQLSGSDLWALESFSKGTINAISNMKGPQKAMAQYFIKFGLLEKQGSLVKSTDLGNKIVKLIEAINLK